MMNACKSLIGKPQAKKPFGIPRYRGKNNIKNGVKKQVLRVLTGFI
jgi:hypothetical protein